ncbi:hypothetical protein HDV05_002172 [Chytridiales sp. JEL 0842]|nr:hypothetical protein HDV05_002172 [Chytridiales sp. JEL 0842]
MNALSPLFLVLLLLGLLQTALALPAVTSDTPVLRPAEDFQIPDTVPNDNYTSYYLSLRGVDPSAPANTRGRRKELPYYDLGHTLRSSWGTKLNDYPVVLVHGFAGFGKPLVGINYFGGIRGNVQEFLEGLGYRVFVADLGPVSSNWERACELYAQIKGTRVDYGLARSQKYGHKRFGRDYTGKGFYPEWGTNANAKVNFITHSMGGPTTQMLISLLKYGFEGEVNATTDGSLSPLFSTAPNKPSMVNAMLSLSAPYLGTNLSDLIGRTRLITDLVKAVVGVANLLPGVYDTKLDHWGLDFNPRQESFDSYVRDILKSPWYFSNSNALYDLSVVGTRDPINTWVKPDPDVYYFSSSNYATSPTLFSGGKEVPMSSMFPVFAPFGAIMGSTSKPELGIDSQWWKNDGVVNTISNLRPAFFNDSTFDSSWGNVDLTFDASRIWFWPRGKPQAPERAPVKGKMHVVGKALDGFDHLRVTGTIGLFPDEVFVIFQNAVAVLASTP